MRKFFVVILVIFVALSIWIFKKCNRIIDEKIQDSGLEYYEPNKFDNLKIDEFTERKIYKYVDSLNNHNLNFIKLEKPIEFCASSNDECDDIVVIKRLTNVGSYFIVSSTFSFMNKSYGILYSEKEESEIKKYPILSVRFLRRSLKRKGSFYFVEAKI